jgi:hypothetical protein
VSSRYFSPVMRKYGAALVLGVLLVTSACSSGSRASEGEVSHALQKGGTKGGILGDSGADVTKKAADCIAKVLVASDISNRALQAIVDGSKTYKPTQADTLAATKVAPKIVKCLPSGLR